MAFGEFNSARLKPTWKDSSAPAKDSTGWKRGQNQKWTDGESEFMRSADPKADRAFYGPTFGARPNGPQYLTDRFKGAKGIDAGEPEHGDDGVR